MWIKILIPVISILIGGIFGIFSGIKMAKNPICNCPEFPTINIPKCPPSIKVQSLDLNSIKKIKGPLTFAPVYNGDVYMITGDDTTKMQ